MYTITIITTVVLSLPVYILTCTVYYAMSYACTCFDHLVPALFQLQLSTIELLTRNLCIYKSSCWILSRSGLHSQTSVHKPPSNRKQHEKCVAFTKVYSLQKGWTVEKWQKVDFLMNHPSNYSPMAVNTAEEPTWTQDSPRKLFLVTLSMGVCKRSAE